MSSRRAPPIDEDALDIRLHAALGALVDGPCREPAPAVVACAQSLGVHRRRRRLAGSAVIAVACTAALTMSFTLSPPTRTPAAARGRVGGVSVDGPDAQGYLHGQVHGRAWRGRITIGRPYRLGRLGVGQTATVCITVAGDPTSTCGNGGFGRPGQGFVTMQTLDGLGFVFGTEPARASYLIGYLRSSRDGELRITPGFLPNGGALKYYAALLPLEDLGSEQHPLGSLEQAYDRNGQVVDFFVWSVHLAAAR